MKREHEEFTVETEKAVRPNLPSLPELMGALRRGGSRVSLEMTIRIWSSRTSVGLSRPIQPDPDFAVESREQLDSRAGFSQEIIRHWDLTPDGQRLLVIG